MPRARHWFLGALGIVVVLVQQAAVFFSQVGWI